MLSCLTERGEASSTDVVPDASAVKYPGIGMGSGDTFRVFMYAASPDLQFPQENPNTCSMTKIITKNIYSQRQMLFHHKVNIHLSPWLF